MDDLFLNAMQADIDFFLQERFIGVLGILETDETRVPGGGLGVGSDLG